MKALAGTFSPRILRWELPFVCLVAWLAFIAVPLKEGGLGLSWDALHHHFYLGWSTVSDRFSRDFMAAAYQSYQFPYLYWPLYKMAVAGWSGTSAGVVLATLSVAIVPPVWLVARTCLPGASAYEMAMRGMAVALALASSVVLTQFGSTSNDLLAAAPMAWAIALGLQPLDQHRPPWLTPTRCAVLSGLFAGLAVACKLSNGPLALAALPPLWLLAAPGALLARLLFAALAGACTVAAFLLAYGYWGAQLWRHFGNPVYPFYHAVWEPVRVLTGWTP